MRSSHLEGKELRYNYINIKLNWLKISSSIRFQVFANSKYRLIEESNQKII